MLRKVRIRYSTAPVEGLQYALAISFLPEFADHFYDQAVVHSMYRSHRFPVFRCFALLFAIHILAALGVSGTVPSNRKHRRTTAGSHKGLAKARPKAATAAARTPVRRVTAAVRR